MDMNDDDNGSFSELMSYKCMVITKPSLELLQIKDKHIKTQREESPSACCEPGPVMTYPGWDCKWPSVLHSGLNVGRPPEA